MYMSGLQKQMGRYFMLGKEQAVVISILSLIWKDNTGEMTIKNYKKISVLNIEKLQMA
ncbi:hypothetical protein SDC9_133412 [bioreactor metagenome]|uniref:Uncharacterized protein n=1 Tax=bioreactor metagenome TaxID=1076179 RepID=A0A645DBJ8_9ZZZZ